MAHPTTHPSNQPLFLDLHMPTHFPAQTDVLTWCQSIGPGEGAILVLLGVIYLMFGINIYKFTVMLNAGILGSILGFWIGDQAGNGLVGAAVGGFTAAALVFPLMKHAVTIMAALTGAVVGAGLWRLFSPHPDLYWAGAGSGAVVLALLAQQIFRGCVIMHTAMQGSAMLAIGVLALVTKYKTLTPQLVEAFKTKPFILPLAIFLPALLGLIYQQSPSAGGAAAAAAKKK